MLAVGFENVKRGMGAGSREQGGGLEGACTPTNRERPGRAGLDTHVPLRFTASGQGLLPLLESPLPLRLFGQLYSNILPFPLKIWQQLLNH